jgi:uncharacterized SAM-binding protein YcdF (DUF218 family)
MLILAVLIAFVLWRLVRAGRTGERRILGIVAGVALFLWCWPPVAWLSVAGLEKSFPFTPVPAGDADAIVALAGNFYATNWSQPEAEPGFTTYLRTAHAAWLFHHWKPLPIVVSGGTGQAGDPTIADLMRRQLIEEGVPDSMITVENHSQTTYENATGVARILLPQGLRRIVLVTEAFHMPRAERCFRKQGFDVVRAACCYVTAEQRSFRDMLLPGQWAIHVNSDAIHEWVGLAWYKIRGRI